MEEFVSNLIKTSDLSVLTTKAVRKAYEAHIKQSLDKEEKGKLKQIVSSLLDDLAQTLKAASPTKSPQVKLSPKKSTTKPSSQQNSSPRKSPVKGSVASVDSEISEASLDTNPSEIEKSSKDLLERRTPPESPLKTSKKHSPRRKAKKIQSYAESSSEEEGAPSNVLKKTNGKKAVSSDDESVISLDENVKSGSKKTPLRKTKSNKKRFIEHDDNEMVPSQSNGKQIVSDEESDLPSISEKQDSDSVCSADKENTTSKDDTAEGISSPKKKLQRKPKPKKKLSVGDVVEAVMESDKDDASSFTPSLEVESEGDSEDEKNIAKRNTNKRRKLLSSDNASQDSDNKKSLKTGKLKNGSSTKKGALKTVAKRKKMMTDSEKDDEFSDEDDEPLKPVKKPAGRAPTAKRKKLMSHSQNEMDNNDEDNQPITSKPKLSSSKRKPAAKKSKISVSNDLDESGSDFEMLKQKKKPTAKSKAAAKKKVAKKKISSDSDTDLSDSEGEPLKSKKPTTKISPASSKKRAAKLKKVDSDSDDGFSESEDEPLKPPKPSPGRAFAKKNLNSKKQNRVNSESEASIGDVDTQSVSNSQNDSLMSQKQNTDMENSDNELAKQSKMSAPKRQRKISLVDSDDSGDDRLQIDFELSEPEDESISTNVESPKPQAVVDSDDSGTSMEIVNSPEPIKKKGKKVTTQSKGQGKLANLRKICHCAGIILRNKIELLGCDTDQEKITRIQEILRSKGMKGQPSMNKAKTLKLKKEASELDQDNIISDTGRSRRKVKSRFPMRAHSPSPSPKKVPPLRLKLSRIRDIVDSEGSESD